MCYHRVRLVLDNQVQLMSFHMCGEGNPVSQVIALQSIDECDGVTVKRVFCMYVKITKA